MTIIQSDAQPLQLQRSLASMPNMNWSLFLVVQHSYDGRTSDHPCVKGGTSQQVAKGALWEGGERVRPGSHQGASVVCPTTTMPPWPSQDATAMSLQCYFMPQLQWCDTYLLTNMCCLIQITIGLLTKNHFDSCRREASKNYLANFVR